MLPAGLRAIRHGLGRLKSMRTYTTLETHGLYTISRVDDLTPDGQIATSSYLVGCPDGSSRPFFLLHVARAYVNDRLAVDANVTPIKPV